MFVVSHVSIHQSATLNNTKKRTTKLLFELSLQLDRSLRCI